MRALKRIAGLVVVGVVVAFAGGWFWAGRQPGPIVEIRGPERFIGHTTTLELAVEAPNGRFSDLEVTVEQNGNSHLVFQLEQPDPGAEVRQDGADRIYVMRPVGKQALPQLQAGQARITARATRPVLFGLRTLESTVTRDVEVRLEPPRIGVVSTYHYVNHGGAEFVVYRVTPPDVESGVRVGDLLYPGFPASGAGLAGGEATHVALFALLQNQDLNTRISLYARDAAGNEAEAGFDHRVFPKRFARSRISLDDRFLARVVPAIAAHASDLELSIAPDDLLPSFLRINRNLRQSSDEVISALAPKTLPTMMWKAAFQQLGNSQVESRFADHRTYMYKGKEVDQQVHLGFDLAATANVPVVASQQGVVLLAEYVGIYGNCVVIDHGLGVQSLYAHLSSLSVTVGDTVDAGAALGRSGMTGLAGGDHLHFTMLVNGHAVDPVEWWDPKWMEDRVLRKLRAAGSSVAGAALAK